MALLFIAVLSLASVRMEAQDAARPYGWEAGDIALLVPAGWDDPITSLDDSNPRLTMSDRSSAADPAMERSITIVVYAHAGPDTDLGQMAGEALAAQATPAVETLPDAVIAGGYGPGVWGLSAERYGLSYAARLGDGRVLVVTGQASATDRQALQTIIAGLGLMPGAESEPFVPGYRSAWTVATDEPIAALTASDDVLYVAGANGLLAALDAQTGTIQGTYRRDALAGVTDLSATGDTLYAAVPDCACLRVFGTDGEPHGSIGGFGEGAPVNVAADGAWLYATDRNASGYRVRAWFNGTEVPSIPLTGWLDEQPMLAIDGAGRLAAVSAAGDVLAFMSRQWVRLAPARTDSPPIHDAAFITDETLALATESGLDVRDMAGALMAAIDMPADAVAANGAIYASDATGIHALAFQDTPDRISDEQLIPGEMVAGRLDAVTTEQRWTYEGTAGERVTISAVEASRAGTLDVAVKLIAPDGSVEASNDDQRGADLYGLRDAFIERHPLQTTGTYTIVAERVTGDGLYRLGVTISNDFTLASDSATQIAGWLGDAVPSQRWRFEVDDSTVLTVTMQATTGDLDPALRLIAPNGDVLATNDDAADPAFGRDAQLVRVELPGGGTYTLEAGRFDGAGAYTVVVVRNS